MIEVIIMSDENNVKLNDGSLMESYIRVRISKADKEKIRDHFGSFSAMREYVLKVIEDKGDKVKREVKK
jgi:hypothetical protein